MTRGGLALLLFIGFFLLTPLVLAYRQNQYFDQISNKGEVGKKVSDIVAAKRGSILDRNGAVLAGTGVRYEIFANPKLMAEDKVDINSVVELLAGEIGAGYDLALSFADPLKTRVVICESATEQQRDKILELKKRHETSTLVKEIGVERLYNRTYPVSGLPGSVFGWVRNEDGRLTGVEGLECSLDFQLRGHDGRRVGLRGLDGKPIAHSYYDEEIEIDGNDVILTIDQDIQEICYAIIADWVQKTGAKRGAVIVVEPGTGDFLALAQYPCIDPGRYGDCADNDLAYSDFIFHALYEPGSVGKPLIASVGISEGLISTESAFRVDVPRLYLNGYWIGEYHNIWPKTDRHSVREIIIKSSNVGMSRVGIALGEEIIRETFDRFGFNEEPDVFLQRLPEANLPADDKKLCDVELANLSFGQGYAVTPAQLALAYNVFASDGWFHPGRLVKGTRDNVSGEVRLPPSDAHPLGWQAISPEACTRMVDVLHDVTVNGTGKNAAVEGFLIAGKTGTAQVAAPGGGYYDRSEHYNIVTFAGFGPLPEPEYTIVVVLERPRSLNYDAGGKAAAPCFKQIFEGLMHLESRRSAEEG